MGRRLTGAFLPHGTDTDRADVSKAARERVFALSVGGGGSGARSPQFEVALRDSAVRPEIALTRLWSAGRARETARGESDLHVEHLPHGRAQPVELDRVVGRFGPDEGKEEPRLEGQLSLRLRAVELLLLDDLLELH